MIFFLFGPDTYRSRQKLNEIKAKFIREIDQGGLNLEVLAGKNLTPANFENAVFSAPFLAKKRLVVAEGLLSENRDTKTQKEILAILKKGVPQDTVLVFWESEISAKKGKKKKSDTDLFSFLKKTEFIQEFNLLDAAGVQRWLNQEIKNRRGKIEPAAIKLLSDLVGNDLWRLNAELDKLIAKLRGKIITQNDVSDLVQIKLEENVFKLTDALGQKNKPLALKLISDQLKSGVSPIELLAKIVWQFKNLLLVKEFSENFGFGYQTERLTSRLGLHPFVIKKSQEQAKFYSLPDLKKTYRQLLETDYKLKTSQIDSEVLFDLLIAKS